MYNHKKLENVVFKSSLKAYTQSVESILKTSETFSPINPSYLVYTPIILSTL